VTWLSFTIGLVLGFAGGIILSVIWIGYVLARILVAMSNKGTPDEPKGPDGDEAEIEPIIHGDGQMWVDQSAQYRAN
jgi:hypothetical protein